MVRFWLTKTWHMISIRLYQLWSCVFEVRGRLRHVKCKERNRGVVAKWGKTSTPTGTPAVSSCFMQWSKRWEKKKTSNLCLCSSYYFLTPLDEQPQFSWGMLGDVSKHLNPSDVIFVINNVTTQTKDQILEKCTKMCAKKFRAHRVFETSVIEEF